MSAYDVRPANVVLFLELRYVLGWFVNQVVATQDNPYLVRVFLRSQDYQEVYDPVTGELVVVAGEETVIDLPVWGFSADYREFTLPVSGRTASVF